MNLLPIEDPRWQQYRGGYNRTPFDASAFAQRLANGTVLDSDWDILWDDLHHQGDIGEASYAIIPYLAAFAEIAEVIPWHVFGFAATVEIQRVESKNPPIPEELENGYEQGLDEICRIALDRRKTDLAPDAFVSAMACIAARLGERSYAEALFSFGHEEAERFLKEQIG